MKDGTDILIDGISGGVASALFDVTLMVLAAHFLFYLLIAVAVWFVIEVGIVWRRMHKGETLWSALSKWGSSRAFKELVDAVPIATAQMGKEARDVAEEVNEFGHIAGKVIVRLTPIKSDISGTASAQAAPSPEPAPEPTVASAPVPIATATATAAAPADPLPDGADMLSDMYAMKAGVLALLGELREAGGVDVKNDGSLSVLLADISAAEVHDVWGLGAASVKAAS